MLQRDSSHELIKWRKAGSLLHPKWCKFPQTELHSRDCSPHTQKKATTAFSCQWLEGGAGPKLIIGGTWFSFWRWLVLSEYEVPENCHYYYYYYYYYKVLKIFASKTSLHPFPQPYHSLVFPCAVLNIQMGLVTTIVQEEWLCWCLVGLNFSADNNKNEPWGWVQQELDIQWRSTS